MRHAWMLAALALAGCGRPAARPPSTAIWAVFDPATGHIPTPNDLVRDPDAGHLALPITPDLAPADADFRAYLNTLDGYPTSTPAVLHFSGAIDPSTLTASDLLVWKLDAHGGAPTEVEVKPSYADADFGLTLYPAGGWARGARYMIAIRGGADGVSGSNGEDVLASPAFYFLRAGQDLTQHPWAFPGDTPAARMATAQALEAVRQTLEPLFKQVVAQGWSRQDIALLFTFTTSSHAEIQFDPLSQQLPLPNDLLIDPGTGLVSIPPDPADTPAQATIKRALDTLDGFSTTGPLSATATAPVDSSTVTAAHLRLFQLANPPVEVKGISPTLYADGMHLFGQLQSKNAQDPSPDQPFTVLHPKTSYFWVLTGLRGTDGSPVDAQPVGALLRLPDPLVKDGKSQVTGISDADAARLEPLRARLAPALDALASLGIARSSMAAVVPFTTLDVQGHTRALVKLPYDQHLDVTAANVEGHLAHPRRLLPRGQGGRGHLHHL